MTSESTIGTNVTAVGKILTEAIDGELVSVIGKSKAEEEEEEAEADLAAAAAADDIAPAVDEATGAQSNNFAQA